ncbi:MAG TPA: hypothetical protein VEQ60_03510 [Longimicrobium sp.]|nr:hypothetical protein [Longimicrobium sp.]
MQAATQVPVTVLIITSAAVGAITSSLITFFSAYLERRARRRELLLKEAVALAHQRVETMCRIAEATQAQSRIPDAMVLAEKYYQWVTALFNEGRLPEEVRDAHNRSIARLDAE